MLNEIGEYEQYTLSPEELLACKNRRLKHCNIKNSFSGLERVMTTITRHFIFDTPVGSNENELREILKAWCGFNHEAKTILPEHFDGWLKNYIKRVLAFETACACFEYERFPDDLKTVIEKFLAGRDFDIKESLAILENLEFTNDDVPRKIKDNTGKFKNLLEALDELPDKDKNFSKNLFGSLDAKGDTPFRAITYDRIIANALLAGKLRCYCLACDEELFETRIILKKGKKLSAKDKDVVLKMTAEYLLQRRNSNQEFIVTNNANMMNWLAGEKPDCSKRENYAFAKTKEKLFEIIKIEGINATKVKLHPEWARHFRLIEDGIDEKWGRIFFSDNGSSEPLQENVHP
ncbi:MAG: hypothetical protein IJQ85_05675 [Selenomonadaceae bacterium]|nr:hypothetical protein [Selenomonadaceae bacterium]